VKGEALNREMNPADEVGWCHNCGTLQLLRDAPWLPVPAIFGHAHPVPCCCVCREDEPWEFGVWPMPACLKACGAQRHESWSPLPCDVCGAGSEFESVVRG
jgi:hypothetical protein